MREAVWLTGVGLTVGLACALGAATLMRSLLFGVQAFDAATLIATTALLAFASLLATYIPARRAAQVDPMVALRYE
jgi:ABC-type antimicrobial peptide transport system permease subunit